MLYVFSSLQVIFLVQHSLFDVLSFFVFKLNLLLTTSVPFAIAKMTQILHVNIVNVF